MNDEFYKTKEGKIWLHGIHEHNSGLGILLSSINWFKYSLENDVNQTKEEQLKVLESMLKAKDKCKASIDYLYVNLNSKDNE